MIPDSGNIKDHSLPRLLASLNKDRRTGTLTVSTPVVTKKLYLDKGNAIFASSTDEDDRLGEVLVKAGKISLEQYDKSVGLLKETGERQGAILVKLGYMTPGDLFWGVKHQVKEIIYSLFQLEDAEYEFQEGDARSDEVITLNMSTGNLIYEGVKRIKSLKRISREMPAMDSVPVLGTDPSRLFQDVVLSSHDKQMLQMIDSKTTMQELVNRSSAGSFEAMKTLYVLYSLGIIEVKDTPSEDAEAVSLEDILIPFHKEREALMKRVDELYADLGKLSARELLEAGEGADPETIRKSYYKLMKEFHPDRFLVFSDPSITDKVIAVIEAITNAYSSLRDADKGAGALPAGNPEARLPEGRSTAEEGASSPAEALEEPETPVMQIEDTEEAVEEEEPEEPEGPGPSIDEADLLISQGEHGAAMDIYNRLLSKNPDDVHVLQRIEDLKTLLKLIGKTIPSSAA